MPTTKLVFLQAYYGKLQHALTAVINRLSHSTTPWLKNALIHGFLKCFPATNLNEAARPNIHEYTSFNDFFTRTLQPTARPLAQNGWICPADGMLMETGQATGDSILQAKKHHYTLSGLLGNPTLAEQFHSAYFATTYLAPTNYHRVHCPCTAQLTDMILIPGMLHSVKPSNITNFPQLYTRNERLVMRFDTSHGPMAVIMIGALFVGSIETPWAGIVNQPRKTTPAHTHYDTPINIERGQELGHFHYGSCVIWLGPATLTINPQLQPNTPVLFGQLLATSESNQ